MAVKSNVTLFLCLEGSNQTIVGPPRLARVSGLAREAAHLASATPVPLRGIVYARIVRHESSEKVIGKVDFHPGDFVSLLADPGITKGVVLGADGYFVRVQWITRVSMEGRVTTHREVDLCKLAYRVSPHPDRDQRRNDEVRPSA